WYKMKNIVVNVLVVSLIVMSFRCAAIEVSQTKQIKSECCKKEEIKDFMLVLINKDNAFRAQYEEVGSVFSKIIDVLLQEKSVDSELQIKAVQETKKA